MAQTTTAINACDVDLFLDNDSGTATDISGSTNNATINLSVNQAELYTLGGNDFPSRLNCGRDCTVDLTIVYSTAAAEGMALLKDWFFNNHTTARTLSIYVPDKNVGSDYYTGEFFINSLSIPLQAGEASPIAVDVSLAITGAYAWSTATT